MTPAKTSRSQKAKQLHTCKAVASLIGDYLTADLAPDTLRAFENHLSRCEDCLAFLKTYKKTIEATREFLQAQGSHKTWTSMGFRAGQGSRS